MAKTPPAKKPDEPQASPSALSVEHLSRLEVIARDIEIARLQRSIKEGELKQRLLEQKVGAFEVEAAQRALVQADLTHEGKKKLRTALILDIKDIYGISDSFGYNPDTGEIVRG